GAFYFAVPQTLLPKPNSALSVALTQRGLWLPMGSIRLPRQLPYDPRGKQRNEPKKHKCWLERIMIDQPSRRQAREHSSESRAHTRESPDGSHCAFGKHISGDSQQICQ